MRTVFAAAAITIGAALGEARADGPFNVLECLRLEAAGFKAARCAAHVRLMPGPV